MEASTSVRLTGITIDNFRNVEHGQLQMADLSSTYDAGMLGIYGPNGSGKSTVIRSLGILKSALCGDSIDAAAGDEVMSGAGEARLEFCFDIRFDDDPLCYVEAFYSLKIRSSQVKGMAGAPIPPGGNDGGAHAEIFDESLSTIYHTAEDKSNKTVFVSTESLADDIPFQPAAKLKSLIGNRRKLRNDLLVARMLCRERGCSFIFSKVLYHTLNAVREPDQVGELKVSVISAYSLRLKQYHEPVNQRNLTAQVLSRLKLYGMRELFVVCGDHREVLFNLNALPGYENFADPGLYPGGGLLRLKTDGPQMLPATLLASVHDAFTQMNAVLAVLVPGLSLELENLGEKAGSQGEKLVSVRLCAVRQGGSIPLDREAGGVRKLIALLHLLLCVYGRRSITVAVDDLDAGIFEQLLGVLLKLLSEQGKGQLIFTAHNLRPLETIDKIFIAFAGNDPADRYFRMRNVKTSNNLRDFYLRTLRPGNKNETVTGTPNEHDLACAFAQALTDRN